MKTSALLLVIALYTGSVAATDFSDIVDQFPECSLECVVAGAEKFGCEVTDIECQCAKMEEIVGEVSPCMVDAGCKFEQITDVAGIVAGLCTDDGGGNFSAADESTTNDDEDDDEDEGETDAAAQLRGASLVGAVVLAVFAAVL